MPNTTPLDTLINYKADVISKLSNAKSVVALMLNNPDIDMDSDAAYDITSTNIYDFDYVDKTVERSDAYIMVDCDMLGPTSGSVNAYEVYVQVVCSKSFMRLPSSTFKGVKGNRCDNLVRQIDFLLNGTRIFGIGKLDLASVTSAVVPDSFTSKMLTYRVVDYRGERYGNHG